MGVLSSGHVWCVPHFILGWDVNVAGSRLNAPTEGSLEVWSELHTVDATEGTKRQSVAQSGLCSFPWSLTKNPLLPRIRCHPRSPWALGRMLPHSRSYCLEPLPTPRPSAWRSCLTSTVVWISTKGHLLHACPLLCQKLIQTHHTNIAQTPRAAECVMRPWTDRRTSHPGCL